LLATINTDDPGISNIDIKHEFEVAAPIAGLDLKLSALAQRNALQIAFLSESDKKLLIESKHRS
jgi:adenosine deaminase